MKKIIALMTIAVAALAVYSYSARMELNAIKEIKSMGSIKRELSDRKKPQDTSDFTYTKNAESDPSDFTSNKAESPLLEPTDTQLDDILERIKMLRQHLLFQPSQEWIDDVITAAEFEIKFYRENQ